MKNTTQSEILSIECFIFVLKYTVNRLDTIATKEKTVHKTRIKRIINSSCSQRFRPPFLSLFLKYVMDPCILVIRSVVPSSPTWDCLPVVSLVCFCVHLSDDRSLLGHHLARTTFPLHCLRFVNNRYGVSWRWRHYDLAGVVICMICRGFQCNVFFYNL